MLAGSVDPGEVHVGQLHEREGGQKAAIKYKELLG
jgi:hypothetical protein